MFHFRSRSFPARSGSLRVEGVFRVPGARRRTAGVAATALPSQPDAAVTVFALRRKDHDLELGSGSQNEPAHPQMSGCPSLTFSPRLDAVIAGRGSPDRRGG